MRVETGHARHVDAAGGASVPKAVGREGDGDAEGHRAHRLTGLRERVELAVAEVRPEVEAVEPG